jgi:trk system potassium uptake protein TrkA
MNCCIIGVGLFGYTAALKLIENGMKVCAVDKDISVISDIQDKVSYAVCLEVIDENSLKSISVETFDVIILAMGQNFEELVIIAGLLKKQFHVPTIICRASTDQQKTILNMIGIEYVILPEKESALELVDKISIGYGYFHRITDNYSLTYVSPKKSWIGMTLRELKEKYNQSIIILGKKVDQDIEEVNVFDEIVGTELFLIGGSNEKLLHMTKH